MIQLPDPGTGVPADKAGDSPWLAMKKVRENFTDTNNAASRLVGTAAGQIPLAQDTFRAANEKLTSYLNNPSTTDVNTFEAGTKFLVIASAANASPYETAGEAQVVKTYGHHATLNARFQESIGYTTGQRSVRVGTGAWQPITTHTANYTRTTAAGANVAVDSTGALMRSTSSERYKDILAPLVLDDAKYAQAMSLKPIVYRSTAEADNPAHHYYSFSAEELGAHDPAFTLWRTTEMVTDAEGNVVEQPLAEKQAEGLNINALLAMGHAIAIKQDKLIKALEARIEILEAR